MSKERAFILAAIAIMLSLPSGVAKAGDPCAPKGCFDGDWTPTPIKQMRPHVPKAQHRRNVYTRKAK